MADKKPSLLKSIPTEKLGMVNKFVELLDELLENGIITKGQKNEANMYITKELYDK